MVWAIWGLPKCRKFGCCGDDWGTIWHLGQFGTEDNLAPGQFGTKSVKEDNLAPRTIWHRNEKGTIWHRHEKGTIWHRSVKGTIWHRNEKRTIWHQDNLTPQCKTDNLAPSSSAKGTQRYCKCVSWIDISRYLYWIFSANIWGIYYSWRVSVRPSGAGLGNMCQ